LDCCGGVSGCAGNGSVEPEVADDGGGETGFVAGGIGGGFGGALAGGVVDGRLDRLLIWLSARCATAIRPIIARMARPRSEIDSHSFTLTF